MIFNYNPITGLNYYSQENQLLKGVELPEKIITQEVIEEWLNNLKKTTDTFKDLRGDTNVEFCPVIISNVPYEVFEKRLEEA